MTTTDENSNINNGVVASSYDDLRFKVEMSFRYRNYNPETNTFRVDLYTGLGKTETKELHPVEWEHFNDKEEYERTDHTEKEKWILTTAKEIVSKYKGYPDHVKDWGEVNKSKYEEYDFDEAELWIDYKERCVYIRLYCPKTRLDHVEYFDLDDLETVYYEKIETNFLNKMKDVKKDLMYYFDEYVLGCVEDFIDQIKEDEEEEIDLAIEKMKEGFCEWMKKAQEADDRNYKSYR